MTYTFYYPSPGKGRGKYLVIYPPDSEPLPFSAAPHMPLIKSAQSEKKMYMFEPLGEFIHFPDWAAFYGILGRQIFLVLFLFPEKV